MKLKALRKERNYSQEQLATLSGLNVRTIQRLEKGQTPSGESIKCLAAALGVKESQIMDSGVQDNAKNANNLDKQSSTVVPFILIAFAAIFVLFAAKSETVDAATGAFFYVVAAVCFLIAALKMYKSRIGVATNQPLQ